MSFYQNLCFVKFCIDCCKKDAYTSYFLTAIFSSIYGLFNLIISIIGSIVLNNSQYDYEDDICFDTFLFNFLIVLYYAIYSIILFYNATTIIQTKNVKWTYYLISPLSLSLIILGGIEYRYINNCISNNSTLFYQVSYIINCIQFLFNLIIFIIGYKTSRNNNMPIHNNNNNYNNYNNNVDYINIMTN